MYYSYLPGFFLHLCHQNTIAWVCAHCRSPCRWTGTCRLGLGTRWPKGIWTWGTRWCKKFRSFTTTGRSDSTISQLNKKRNKDYKLKRKTRNFTLWLDVLLVLCTPWVTLYSICTVNNTKNKEAGKFPLLADSRINCRLRVGRKSLFVRSSVVDDNGRLWMKVIIVTFLDAVATVDVAGAEHRSQVTSAGRCSID